MSTRQKLMIDDEFVYEKIKVYRKDNLLGIESDFCSRVIDMSGGCTSTVSLKNSTGIEFSGKTEYPDFSFIGINMPNSEFKTEYEVIGVEVTLQTSSMYDAEHIRVNVTIRENIQQVEFIRSYFIYTEIPVLAVQNSISSAVYSNIYWSHRGGLNDNRDYPAYFTESSVDTFQLQSNVVPVKSVEFQGRTDYTNNLVIEHDVVTDCVNGNLLFCENGECGIFLLQEAPPSAERRDFESHDFRLSDDNVLFSCGWGITPEELTPNKQIFTSYRHVIGFYSKDNEQAVLKQYLKKRFPQNTQKDFSVTVNPWGVGRFPALVNEQFLLDEIKAASAIGATHYQIDDGWQFGRALSELINNNRSITSKFWEISEPHLPHGFSNICDVGKKNDVEIALWVAPSANQEYRDWESFADILFGYYQEYGIRMFKVDAVIIKTKLAEDNLYKLVRALRDRSDGNIIFNFDTTNGQRPGYYMFLEYGNIFLENRYVYGAGIGYHTEDTLNNLWTLSQYMRTQTLQIEIPSHEDVNHKFYEDKGMIPPDIYPPDYWAAVSLFANPLLWLAPSTISSELIAEYRKIIDLHLKYRERIFAGDIIPIGSEPNGFVITGFISHNSESNRGLLLLFREHAAPNLAEINIPELSGMQISCIYDSGNTTVSVTAEILSVDMKKQGSFCLFEYSE